MIRYGRVDVNRVPEPENITWCKELRVSVFRCHGTEDEYDPGRTENGIL